MSKRPPEGNPTATLRLIDGGITCNNPTDVAVHEARLLFGRERRLAVVSVGTGQGVAEESAQSSYLPSWLQNLVNATGDVAQTDATARGPSFCLLMTFAIFLPPLGCSLPGWPARGVVDRTQPRPLFESNRTGAPPAPPRGPVLPPRANLGGLQARSKGQLEQFERAKNSPSSLRSPRPSRRRPPCPRPVARSTGLDDARDSVIESLVAGAEARPRAPRYSPPRALPPLARRPLPRPLTVPPTLAARPPEPPGVHGHAGGAGPRGAARRGGAAAQGGGACRSACCRRGGRRRGGGARSRGWGCWCCLMSSYSY